MNYRKVSVNFFLALISITLLGQDTLQSSRSINWQIDEYELKMNKSLFPAIRFNNAVLNEGSASVPEFQHRFEIPRIRNYFHWRSLTGSSVH